MRFTSKSFHGRSNYLKAWMSLLVDRVYFSFSTLVIWAAFLVFAHFTSNRVVDNQSLKLYKRRLSWIPTFLSAVVMTLGSIPFLWDFLSYRDITVLQTRPKLEAFVSSFFVAYLYTDVLFSFFFYPLTKVTGWIHHISYALLVPHIYKNGWGSVFLLVSFMEFPTVMLAMSNFWPRRNQKRWILTWEMAFTSSFFVTRIVFHIALLILYSTAHGRSHTRRDYPPGSIRDYQISIFFGAALMLHLWWFKNALRGLLRRKKLSQGTAVLSNPTFSTTNIILRSNSKFHCRCIRCQKLSQPLPATEYPRNHA